VADIKAVQNSMSLGASPQQQPKQPVAPGSDATKSEADAPNWDGVERRKADDDRRADSEKRPDFLETRHRLDRRRRRSVSVKV
jgi:hypothetical protein